MRMTQETDYAIRIILLCGEHELEKLSSRFILDTCNIPERWGKIILTKLCKTNILKSSKGIHGGFELNKSLDMLTLHDVLISFEDINFQSEEEMEKYPYKNNLEKVKRDFIDNLKNIPMLDLLTSNQIQVRV